MAGDLGDNVRIGTDAEGFIFLSPSLIYRLRPKQVRDDPESFAVEDCQHEHSGKRRRHFRQ